LLLKKLKAEANPGGVSLEAIQVAITRPVAGAKLNTKKRLLSKYQLAKTSSTLRKEVQKKSVKNRMILGDLKFLENLNDPGHQQSNR
jgi:hypothetical protein